MARQRRIQVELTAQEYEQLQTLIKGKSSSTTMRTRCQILVALDESQGESPIYKHIAQSLDVSIRTISNTINKYIQGGIASVIEYKRNKNSDNSRRKVDERAEAQIISLACSTPPEGYARWSLRLLEKKLQLILEEPVSHDTIKRVLKKKNCDLIK